MDILVYIEVSDRNVMDGVRGLHGQLVFKDRLSQRRFTLEGTATLSDECEMEAMVVLCNTLLLSDEVASFLLASAFDSCWNAVVLGNAAMAGVAWRPLVPWIAEHIEVDAFPSTVHHVQESWMFATSSQ